MIQELDHERSINELLGLEAEETRSAPTDLVRRCYEATAKPLKDLTLEEIRLLIGQKIAPEVLIALVLPRLREQPILEVSFFPGDLLKAVLEVPEDFWKAHVDLYFEVSDVLGDVESAWNELGPSCGRFNAYFDIERPSDQ